jgi:hypothetical protein
MSLETDTNKVDINLSHIDRETKNELEKEVKNLSILIPTNQNNILSSIIEKHIISKFNEIKIITVELDNLSRDNCVQNRNDIIKKIKKIEDNINNMKLIYEILFVKEESKIDDFIENYTDELKLNKERLDLHEKMLKFNINDVNTTSLNIFLNISLINIQKLIKKVNEKIEYYDNGKNNKLFYYTFGYLSWIYNWYSYKTIYKSYTDYLSFKIISVRNRISTIIDKSKNNLEKMSLLLKCVKTMRTTIETINNNDTLKIKLEDLRANIDLQSATIKESLP